MEVLINSLETLKSYCESQNFSGWDPYDGLNSKIFQATPLKHWPLARLAWIQGFKRCPINFRSLLLVPKEHNAKGIGLFLSGYCNLHIYQKISGKFEFGTQKSLLNKIKYLADLLIQMKCPGYSGACWGYNFDWQARLDFLFPKYTPTVVATTFCATALFDAYEITKNKQYLDTAISSAKFILKDLNKTYINEQEYVLSYSPLKGNDKVINASLLGAKTLIQCYKYSGNLEYYDNAKLIVKSCCNIQKNDGSWVYGLLSTQSWIDSYHTGYNLDAISFYQNISGDKSFNEYLSKGYNFYLSNFFEPDGTPIHFKHNKFPIDIHCPGQLFVTQKSLNITNPEDLGIADEVLKWTIKHMQDSKGYFYYQIKKGLSSKISYMRWSNAFMFHALSNYILNRLKV